MYIFIMEKGDMEQTFYIICGICLIFGLFVGITWFRRSKLQKSYQSLRQLSEEYSNKINVQTKELCNLEEARTTLSSQIKNFRKEREDAMQRAAEATENTERLLRSEQGRLAAELQRKKELEEVKLEQEIEKKRDAMNLYYAKELTKVSQDYELQKNTMDAELLLLKAELDDFQARREAVHEAILREKELEEKEEFYSIQVNANDQEDIRVLQSMDLKLHNRDVIPKLIYDLFIKRPLQEMIKRVTGGKKMGGIYKITYKKTGEAYIGKTSSDFGTRWTNHVKTAFGLDGCAHATLHTRLAQDGLWNYTFEILEEVDKDKQSEREAFYINLYGTKKQLNMREGNKNGTQ